MNIIKYILSYFIKEEPNKNNRLEEKGKKKRKTIPKTIRNQVWRRYCGNSLDSKCFCCHQDIKYETWEAGHVIPASKGGPDTIENLRPICISCNRSMGNIHMKEFMKNYSLPGYKKF